MSKHIALESITQHQDKVSVALIGCGGIGSTMLSCLAKLHHVLVKLDKPGLQVTVFDDDVVSESNIGRQLFSEADIGDNKAICLVNRINRCYGLSWEAIPQRITDKIENS